jgi:hypothetical protein
MSTEQNDVYLEQAQERFESGDQAERDAVIKELRENGFDAQADSLIQWANSPDGEDSQHGEPL